MFLEGNDSIRPQHNGSIRSDPARLCHESADGMMCIQGLALAFSTTGLAGAGNTLYIDCPYAPKRIRTSDLFRRREALYPLSYRRRCVNDSVLGRAS